MEDTPDYITQDTRLPDGWTIHATDYKTHIAAERWIAVACLDGVPVHRAAGSTVPIAKLLVTEKIYENL